MIGGGLAGLSSAVALAEAGFRVRLLEKRPHLGGRAASYVLPGGEHIDNCQHVTLGCCTNLEDFYRRVGAGNQIQFFDRLLVCHSGWKARSDGLGGAAGAVAHGAVVPARFPLLGWADKNAIAQALLSIARSGGRPGDLASEVAGENVTMLAWLRKHRQTERAIRRFWEVILVSALDEELDRIDARYGIDVFWKAFLSTRGGYRVGIPRVPLGESVRRLQEIAGRAGRRGADARRGSRIAGRGGPRRRASRWKMARWKRRIIIFPRFRRISCRNCCQPPWLTASRCFANLRNLQTSPITGVHLWFDRTVMSEPFLTLLDSTTQWVFNKTQLSGAESSDAGQYLQLVISASYGLTQRSRQEIIALCLDELRGVFPAIREAALVKGTVVKEMSATFSPSPGSDRWRPAQKSPLPGLFLAGDWTLTGWPSTMEGAVRSATWPPKRSSPKPERQGNFCSRICARRGWRAFGRVDRKQQPANGFFIRNERFLSY